MNMNYFSFRLVAVLSAFALLISCGSSEKTNIEDKGDQVQNKTYDDTKTDGEDLPKEKIKQLKDSLDQAKTAVSPFLGEGCCSEPERKMETCCCEVVYDKYKRMLEDDGENAVEIGMTDPILANCRKLMPLEFDELENPPSEDDDELDDLFN